MERIRIFTIKDAKRTSKLGQVPCRTCDLNPGDCDKQYQISIPGRDDTMVMCMIMGVVSEASSLKIERNGKFITNTEISGAEAAGL